MLYISTDYVFDGRNPPYQHDSSTNPLNDYGIFKLEGEKVVLDQNEGKIGLHSPDGFMYVVKISKFRRFSQIFLFSRALP